MCLDLVKGFSDVSTVASVPALLTGLRSVACWIFPAATGKERMKEGR